MVFLVFSLLNKNKKTLSTNLIYILINKLNTNWVKFEHQLNYISTAPYHLRQCGAKRCCGRNDDGIARETMVRLGNEGATWQDGDVSETKTRICEMMWGEIEERGYGDTSEVAKMSLTRAATGAPSHGLTRLPGRHRTEVLGHCRARTPWPLGCCHHQSVRAPCSP